MNREIVELVKQYRLFQQVTPLQFPNDHDFGHFIAWLERQYILNGTSA